MTAEEELLKLEKELAEAIVKNNLGDIGRLVTDDWIIIDRDGEIVDRARFFEVIKSGALTQIHGTGVQHARTGHRRFCEVRWAMAMRADASHSIYKEVRRRARRS